MDLSRFLKQNNLRNGQIAEYLGVSDAFVSKVCSGKSKLPYDKLKMILSNEEWDTTALTEEPSNVAIATGYSIANAGNGNISSEAAQIAVLSKENEMLKKMLEEKDATIEFLKSLINK